MKDNYNSSQIMQFSGWKSLFAIFTMLFAITTTNAQVTVNPGAGSYTTLEAAFTAINAGTHTGAITVDISADTAETLSSILNASGVGSASYTSVLIQPTGVGPKTILGNIAGHLVDLNGADNVTINGSNANATLVISNTSTATSSSTIRFTNDAVGNTVTNATVLGSTGAGLSSGFGVIYFATGTATGNDSNLISNCNIGPAGTNLPINGIYSLGTSTAIDNSGISILNNNIFDYFNANGATNGMNINSGNSDWIIRDNDLYQTGTRTYLTANVHNGIGITSGSGYTIIGNSIGGNTANAGGTAYAMAGTIATRFVGINITSGTTSSPVNSIQGNTIANFTLNTSSGATTTNGVFCGINVTNGNANIGTVTANTIGSTTLINSIVATSTTSGALVVGINTSSTGTIAIQNNLIGGLSSSGVAASVAGSVAGINVSGTATLVTVSNNVIGNSVANNMRGGTLGVTTGSSLVTGINLPSTPTTANINNNTIQNLSSFGTGTGYVRGIQTATASLATAINWTINNNIINNLTSNSTLTGFGSGLCSALGIHHLASQGCVISGNTISNISNVNTVATTNIIVAGITSANAAVTTTLGVTITKNRIWGLSNSTVGTTALTPPIVAGIAIRSGNNVTEVSNNMISLGNGQTTNTSFIGVWCNNGSTPNPTSMNIYHNTINIEGTAAAGALPSFAFMRSLYILATANTVTVDARNNILQNNRSGGTGQHFAISNGYNATTVSATGWAANASNYNVLNANVSTIGHWTTALNFANWKTTSASDNTSLSAITTNFLNTASGDLHLNMGVTPTQLESGGILIGSVATDYDNQTRPGPTGSVNGGALAPDFGADEFDGVYLDLTPPTISYTPLAFTCDGSVNRTLTTSITDASGVPTSGAGLPVLYWRINAGALNSLAGTYVSGSTYTFSFGSGAILNDVVSYYIVAQDNVGTPNIGAFPSTGAAGFTANPPAATTPPTTPSSYSINGSLSGTFTVGAAGTYTTLTAAINAFNTSCLNGPVVFELIDPTYNEVGAMTINQNPNSSAVNTLTIRPATGMASTVNATVASGAILRILNNYTTINGSNNNTTSRDLTLANASATSPNVLLIGSTGVIPVTNVSIRNCIVVNGANSSTAIVVSDGAALGTAGNFSNITIQNNSVQRAFIGVYAIANPTAGNGNGTLITQNDFNTAGANSIRLVAVYNQGIDGTIISNNNIGNMANTVESANMAGIWLATGTKNANVTSNNIATMSGTNVGPKGVSVTTGTTVSNIVVSKNIISGLTSPSGSAAGRSCGINVSGLTEGVTVEKNSVSNIKNTSTGGWGSNGIELASTSLTANIKVNNNFIFDVASNGFNGNGIDDNGYGMVVSSGAGYEIYHNTVYMNTNQAVAGLPAALNVLATVTTAGAINLRNNIFANTQNIGTERYAILSGAANTVYAAIDYNDYFTTGPNLGFIGSNRVALADIVTGFGGNANSKNVMPVFLSSTDLHLDSASNPQLDGAGTAIVSVVTDIDDAPRDASTPDIGADEINFLSTNQFEFVNGFKVYPNPVDAILNIEYTSDLSNVSVYNLLGQQVLTTKVTATSTQIDLSSLNAGTYLVKVEAGAVSKTVKVIKK